MKNLKVLLMILMITSIATIFSGCDRQAKIVSQNVSQEADNFNVIRRLTVINTRTDKITFELVGAFSITIDNADRQLEVICETGDKQYKKHFVGLNEWVTYVVEDLSGASVDKYRYEVNYLPEMIVPIKFVSED